MDAVPVTVIVVTMPLTFSIADGIAFGFISYAAVRIFSGRFNEISPAVWLLAALFVAKFAFA